ncbi:MAG: 5-(carboxyamino)imidazole ribonucleotide synthase [Sphingomonadaceae bacterium]|nr:5-(carboxyamino)imidazole ribonucleotide synthase [Sphingomonadaceae bacterium]
MIVPPGSTIGILGGGQLGRMVAVAAVQLGYRTHIYAPEASGPAADVSRWTQGRYEDADALARFSGQVDVVTYEFENVPVVALGVLSEKLRPSARPLEVAQDRASEKSFAERLGVAVAPWQPVDDRAALDSALAAIGAPAILKTRRFGYDGKGQARLASAADGDAAWAAIGGRPAVLEKQIGFTHEFSILIARTSGGACAVYDPPENVHRDGILRLSKLPAPSALASQTALAAASAQRIADALDYVGVLACEFFATSDGIPLFNEMAPRVHNSGHWTIEGAVTSQFENHVRAICGLPLGSTALAAAHVEMRNLIGSDVDDWQAILADPATHLHLYGKREARPGRKMGHVTRLRLD